MDRQLHKSQMQNTNKMLQLMSAVYTVGHRRFSDALYLPMNAAGSDITLLFYTALKLHCIVLIENGAYRPIKSDLFYRSSVIISTVQGLTAIKARNLRPIQSFLYISDVEQTV